MAFEYGTVAEYIAALNTSGKFGPQVAAQRTYAATTATTRPPDLLAPALRQLLHSAGFADLYRHQHEALSHIRAGKHVVVATPTASGKSLIYILPVFEAIGEDETAHALFLFPLKALAQDQLKTIEKLWALLPDTFRRNREPAALYDGDTSAYRRTKIRTQPPPVLITNPDMLHLSLLPNHDRWQHVFRGLRYVIIDEVHTYRGVFGSHVAWVMRRLQRICSLYGARPTFILASATIGNPGDHARRLLNVPVTTIHSSGAGTAARNVLLLNPIDSAAASATQLLEAAVHRGLRTIVYCQSRKMTELITIWTDQRLKKLKGRIASYRSGFLPEERRGIEKRLASGELLGVISTSALELGIDIGNLDICLLVGYPGSIMATWQRAGRVGRQQRESLVVLIGHEDALDQYFMRHPEDFFNRTAEPVTMNPANPHIAGPHLVCAAAEHPLTINDPLVQSVEQTSLLSELASKGQLLQSAGGDTWFAARRYPQRQISLRGGGDTYSILAQPQRILLGNIDGSRAIRECHPGAIYLHMARTYHVDKLDFDSREVLVSAVNPPYFTRVLSEKTTEILQVLHTTRHGASQVHYGDLRVTEQITGYQTVATRGQRVISRTPLDMPPRIFTTNGFWIEIPDWIRDQVASKQLHFMGGIHAIEHALIGLMPLLVLCDRNDLGGIAHPWHHQTGGAAIFVYDGYAGGMGLTEQAFATIDQLLTQTGEAIAACPCQLGCPSCIHSPKCGSGNRPIDKEAARYILEQLISSPEQRLDWPEIRPKVNILARTPEKQAPAHFLLPQRFGVFDVETQKSAQEVGGWHRAHLMRISVAVLYENDRQHFTAYTEKNIHGFIERLFALDLVVGFNNKRFDNKVLSTYTDRDLAALPAFDILEAITNQLGYRLSLDRLAEHTLQKRKEGDGLLALRWFREGRLDKLTEYCRTDVAFTRDLLLFGLRQGYLLFRNKAGQTVRLPVDFGRLITALLERGKQGTVHQRSIGG
ncbi:DEAD/DEAH box helicase [Desulfobulbus alkaliphilus]|uniref:DEAD/DEAH box helicase n=1 Tax=Desulfobulbus alkaliphilus TaxID=869814 RepID=UPI00196623E5|nr:DEAD/DEAH box helicase [Desulfobulbus alkaliphilus]MBM9535726.1 DEAD/DEAH box helicase [Desulfobulbus alkaliphilus]